MMDAVVDHLKVGPHPSAPLNRPQAARVRRGRMMRPPLAWGGSKCLPYCLQDDPGDPKKRFSCVESFCGRNFWPLNVDLDPALVFRSLHSFSEV